MGLSPSPAQMPLQGLCSCAPSSRKDLEATSEETAHTVFAQTEYDWPGMGWGSREGCGGGEGRVAMGATCVIENKIHHTSQPPRLFHRLPEPIPACMSFSNLFFFFLIHTFVLNVED